MDPITHYVIVATLPKTKLSDTSLAAFYENLSFGYQAIFAGKNSAKRSS
jgi:hypothetical protein